MNPSPAEKFIQRELSWNSFNRRVLAESLRQERPTLDRLKFLAITASNYDEFFMVRVARLMSASAAGDAEETPLGIRPSAILTELLKNIRTAVQEADDAMVRLIEELAGEGLEIRPPEAWTAEERSKAESIFENELLPICTPVALKPDCKESLLPAQGRIYVAFRLDRNETAVVRLPRNLSRFRDLHREKNRREIILLEDVIAEFGHQFFPGRIIERKCFFRVTRNADMSVDEKRDEDFMDAMQEVLESRKTGFPVRLETRGDSDSAEKIGILLDIPKAHRFYLKAPLDGKAFMKPALEPGFDHLKAANPKPAAPEDIGDEDSLWETLADRDILLHHPYESYAPVIRMVDEAADDPAALAIKMTLYRTGGNSPIAKALIRAAERGVQVTVLVELKARFDEGANIAWARRLEKAGAIVIYGLVVLKVHAKVLMVVRREQQGIRRYIHLGTGNYNDTTAGLYTDMGLMTGRDNITRDAALFFNAVTGYAAEPRLDILHMAPFSLRRETLRLIHREEERARGGEEAQIIAKMNSLVDPEIIEALYTASEAGVKIRLNVRGICCLRPGVAGLSSNIRVVSIIDGYLEHTRAFFYLNGGKPEVYLSSADWMPRNLDRRVELLFPIRRENHKRRIKSALDAYFRDNCRSWNLQSDGTWRPALPDAAPYRVQEVFSRAAASRASERANREKKSLQVRRSPSAAEKAGPAD